ncbi:MAG: DUF1848 domain-containing protein [Christensenellales bacterium]|jgi:hypothetical protein
MIISASRRTDLPAQYCEWFLGRLKEGYAMTANPRNPGQVKRVDLSPHAVDALVIWTKNPLPLMDNLNHLRDYSCCFQFTLTSYSRDIEPGIPSKSTHLIPAFTSLARVFGPKSLVWRYDPILISKRYSYSYHVKYFDEIAKRLEGSTDRCIISFMDFYRSAKKQAAALDIADPSGSEKLALAGELSRIASRHGIKLFACCEELDMTPAGVLPSSCIDAALLSEISGRDINPGRDKNQRLGCGCAKSVDIGAYDSCPGGCIYCYATHSPAKVMQNMQRHDPSSPFLIP